MERKVNLESIYSVSEDVVSREIEGEILIVPLVSGIGDMEDELFNLNETGRAIWERLDGSKTLKEVVTDLSVEFEATEEEIMEDVKGFVEELLKRGMVVEVSNV